MNLIDWENGVHITRSFWNGNRYRAKFEYMTEYEKIGRPIADHKIIDPILYKMNIRDGDKSEALIVKRTPEELGFPKITDISISELYATAGKNRLTLCPGWAALECYLLCHDKEWNYPEDGTVTFAMEPIPDSEGVPYVFGISEDEGLDIFPTLPENQRRRRTSDTEWRGVRDMGRSDAKWVFALWTKA